MPLLDDERTATTAQAVSEPSSVAPSARGVKRNAVTGDSHVEHDDVGIERRAGREG